MQNFKNFPVEHAPGPHIEPFFPQLALPEKYTPLKDVTMWCPPLKNFESASDMKN